RNGSKSGFLKFIDASRVFTACQACLLHHAVIHYIDHYLFGGVYVFERMLDRIVAHAACGGEYEYRRPAAENIKETERRQVRSSFRINGACKTNGPRRYRSQ